MPVDPHDAVVIVVEDNPDNLFVVEILLREDVGVKYYNARASGRQLLKLLESQPALTPDLVLLDIQLPYEDGFAVFNSLQGLAQMQKARVIAVTANVMPHDIEKARAAGFDGFIGKPINHARFPDQIRRVLAGEAVWEAY